MIDLFKNLSIKKKLISSILFIVVVAILVTITYFVYTDLKFYREALKEDTEAVAVVIGDNLISSILWGDSHDAEKSLATLKKIKTVIYAEVYKQDELFATFKASKDTKIPKFRPIEGETLFHGDNLYVFKPIIHGNVKEGAILIVASTEFLKQRVFDYALRACIFSILLIVVVVFLGNKFQKFISEPITKLSNIVKEVSKSHNYSIHISTQYKDEVGILTEGFRHMLDQVNLRNKEIRDSRSFLIKVLDSMPLAVITLNKDDVVTHWNKFAESFTKIRRDDAINKIIYKVSSDFNKFTDHHLDVLEKGEHFVFNRVVFSFASDKYFKVILYPLVESEGMIILLEETTELEKKEMQLRHVQKMETVGTLSGGLAHDFNNVLGGITGAVSLIKFKMDRGDNKISAEDLKTQLDTIEKSTNRASGVVKKLLSLSRANEISYSEVDLNTIIKDNLEILKSSIDKSIEINCNYYEKESKVIADGDQLSQVILNLFVNAGHAMTIMRGKNEKWGGVLNINLEPIEPGEYFRKQYPEAKYDKYWVLTVGDSGVGMTEETIASIYDPFFTTKEKDKGTGLGLAMCYGIIKQHEGFIDVYSELNVGTTFKVFIPVINDKSIINKNENKVDIAYGEGVILLVDDDEQIREVASEMLEECGYDVIIAKDGIEALEIFSSKLNEIDLVLLDLVMPRLDGKHTYIRLKELKGDVKVILSSGFQQDSRVKDILALGVNGFLQKPYTFSKLSQAIYKILEK